MLQLIFNIFIVLVIMLILIHLLLVQSARRLAPNKYEWLLVMSHHEWKRAPKIVTDLIEYKDSEYSGKAKLIIYSDLVELEEEGLIEEREDVKSNYSQQIPLTEYRLSSDGIRKRNEIYSSKFEHISGNVKAV